MHASLILNVINELLTSNFALVSMSQWALMHTHRVQAPKRCMHVDLSCSGTRAEERRQPVLQMP